MQCHQAPDVIESRDLRADRPHRPGRPESEPARAPRPPLAGCADRRSARCTRPARAWRRPRTICRCSDARVSSTAQKAGLYVTYRLADPQVGEFFLYLRQPGGVAAGRSPAGHAPVSSSSAARWSRLTTTNSCGVFAPARSRSSMSGRARSTWRGTFPARFPCRSRTWRSV